MKGLGLLLLFTGCLGAQPAGFEGTVVHAVTRQPLGGVHLRLFSRNFSGFGGVYGAVSDSSGRFSMAGVEPGSYMLQMERTGFAAVGQGSILNLKPGERIADRKIEMAPWAVIGGRVVDENGDPMANVFVQAEPVAQGAPPPALMRPLTTDERGEFLLRVAPGKYRVKAEPEPDAPETPEVRTDGTSPAIYAETYFPGTAAKAQAAVIEPAAGGRVDGIEIRLLRETRRGFSVSGVVTGIPDGDITAFVVLQDADEGWLAGPTESRNTQDGKFLFPDQDAGAYRIYARYSSGKTQLQSAVTEIRVTSADLAGLNLRLAPGAEITGTVELAGAPAVKRSVRLEPLHGVMMENSHSADLDNAGGFRIPNVLPGKYRVRVSPLPENAYIKSQQVDGAAAGVLDLSAGARDAKLKVMVSLAGGSLAGTVLDRDGQPLTNALAMVALMAHPNDFDADRQARVTPDGRYRLTGIPPGKYRVLPLDVYRMGTGFGPFALRKSYPAAEEIEIPEGARIAKDLKLAK